MGGGAVNTPARAARPPAPEPVLVALLALLWAGMSVGSEAFRQPQNLLDMTRYFTEVGLASLAMTLVIISGGIDLSVGSVLALSAVVLGLAWSSGLPIWVAVAGAVAAGAFCGAFNGTIAVAFRVPPLIVTLATMAIYRGLAMGLSRGEAVANYPPEFGALGRGYYAMPFGLQVPGQLVLLAVLALVVGVVLARTRLGRYLYAIGLNEQAARYAAVPVAGCKLSIYTLSGALSGLAAAVLVSRVSTAKADLGTLFELDVITACVLGGTSIFGGRGSIIGTMLGLFIAGSLRRGLDLRGVTSYHQSVVIGLVLIGAVLCYQVIVPAAQNLLTRRSRTEGSR